MIKAGLQGAQFVVANTDAQALAADRPAVIDVVTDIDALAPVAVA